MEWKHADPLCDPHLCFLLGDDPKLSLTTQLEWIIDQHPKSKVIYFISPTEIIPLFSPTKCLRQTPKTRIMKSTTDSKGWDSIFTSLLMTDAQRIVSKPETEWKTICRSGACSLLISDDAQRPSATTPIPDDPCLFSDELVHTLYQLSAPDNKPLSSDMEWKWLTSHLPYHSSTWSFFSILANEEKTSLSSSSSSSSIFQLWSQSSQRDQLKLELAKPFRPFLFQKGQKRSFDTACLSNFMMCDVLERNYFRDPDPTAPFFPLMITRVELAEQLLERKWNSHTRFACFLNTCEDLQKEGGHWVVIYVDKRFPFVEYFDSFGHPPPTTGDSAIVRILRWMMKRMPKESTQLVYGTQNHQGSDKRQCGMYALWFVYERLFESKRHDYLALDSQRTLPDVMRCLRYEWFLEAPSFLQRAWNASLH